MTSLTRCELDRRERALLHPLSVFRLLVLLVAISGLALVQTQMRFMTRDLQIETRKLQERRARMMEQKKALIAQVEQLKRYESVREYAVAQLGLRECPPESAARAVVLAESVARWREVDERLERPADKVRGGEDILATVGGRMLALSSIAVARSAEGE